MWNLSTSIIVVVFMSTGIIQGLLATSISNSPTKFEENLSLYFEEPMDKCDSPEYEIVKMAKKNLKIVRDNFIVSDYVKFINLEDSKIVDISPNAFNAVPNLSCLNIRWNNVTNIFENFLPSFNHTVLTKLNLAHTAFNKTFSDYKCPDYPDPNKKNTVTSKTFLPNVTHLDISDNHLCELPTYLNSSFPNLTHIYLSDNVLSTSSFNRIPATTQYIYLERNRGSIEVSYFPKNIYGLFLNENNLQSNFGYPYQYSNLRVLSLRKCNNFEKIFPLLDNGKLIDLDISSNNLSDIRADVFKNPKSLQRFSLDRNSLHSILFIASFNSLTDLSIAYNNLINITSNLFTNMQQLKKLNLRGNNIAVIDKDAFLNLRMLEKLDLAENRLTTLPVSWMNTLEGLRYLNLKLNPFSSIESMSIYAYSDLNNLILGDHCFKSVNVESLMNLPLNVVLHMSSITNFTCMI